MSKFEKIISKILSGASDKNIKFQELLTILKNFRFEERIKGSHHIFYRKDIEEIINIQAGKNENAKAYQVMQLREIIWKYRLMNKIMKPKYEIMIYRSEQDESFIAEVPELAGCMADGKTYQSALKNVEQIISEWVETAQLTGRPVPEPKGRLKYA
jgi:predicted RNase H-like HicB family nuclease/predicted RNA binding protein YcfA (HicA-like mRNA interferase family)